MQWIGRLVVYERPGSNPMELFNSSIQRSNWDHSARTKRVPIQSSDSKVHWAVEYKRFAKDHTVIGTVRYDREGREMENPNPVQLRAVRKPIAREAFRPVEPTRFTAVHESAFGTKRTWQFP